MNAQGLVGTFVKPISSVGKAISDVTQGVAAQVGPNYIYIYIYIYINIICV